MRCKNCKSKVTKENLVTSGIFYFCSEYCRNEYKPKVKIRQVSIKKQERLKETGGEKELFKQIWEERKNECEDCGKYLREPKAHNFDHIIPKSRGEEYRLDKANIKLICFKCHFEKTNGLVYKGIDLD